MDDLKALYQSVILEHSRQPQNYGHPEATTHEARGYNPLCGDQVTIYLTLEDERLIDVAFEGKGCALCLASASIMTNILKAADRAKVESLVEDLKTICTDEDGQVVNDPEELAALLPLGGVRNYPVRVKCVTLPWQTALAALAGETEATTE
ncbi:MAG: SUF system NifU family Fe-S cluster assembly protein [Kiloniellales bacterium]